jgi:hypothetical protein
MGLKTYRADEFTGDTLVYGQNDVDPCIAKLVDAVRTLLVAAAPADNEQFPGHHKAYLTMVAIPRAEQALLAAGEKP